MTTFKSTLAYLVIALFAISAAEDLIDQLPGIEQAALGFIVTDDRFGRSAVKLTWDSQFKVRSPYDNQIYRVPDQIDPKGLKTAHAFAKYHSEVFNKTEDWEHYNGGQNGIHITLPGFFEFSRSKTHKRVKAFLNHTSKRYGINGEYHSYFQVTMMPPELLDVSDELKRMLSFTKGVFNETTKRTWFNIFQYYGTHYMPYYVLGGKVHMETQIDTTFTRRKDIEYIRTQIGFKFGADTLPDSNRDATEYSPLDPAIGVDNNKNLPIYIGDDPVPEPEPTPVYDGYEAEEYPPGVSWIGFSFSKVKEQYNRLIDEEFRQAATTSIDLWGGDQHNLAPENWREWVPSIIKVPEVIEKKLRPIHELLHDDRLEQVWQQAEAAYKKWWIETKQYEKDSDM